MPARYEYLQLYNHLKKEIVNGTYPASTNLPSERVLITQMNVSRTTIRRALQLLVKDKLVEKLPGIGCRVRPTLKKNEQRTLVLAIDLPAYKYSPYQQEILTTFQQVKVEGVEVKLELIRHDELYANPLGIDGFVVSHISYDDLKLLEEQYTSPTPLLMLNRISERPDFAFLAVDYETISYRLVRRLLLNGAKDIAVIGNNEEDDVPAYAEYVRTVGWKKAYQEITGSVPKHLLFGKDLALDILRFSELLKHSRPQVIYATVMGVLPVVWAALVQNNLVPGRDIDVVCFDDIETYGMPYHPISFIRMPIKKMVKLAVEYFAGMRGPEVIQQCLEPQLVVESCKYLY